LSGGPLCCSGAADQHIDRSEAVFNRVDHFARRIGVSEIGGDAHRVFQVGARPLDVVARARADRDPGAFGGEGRGAGEADAFRAAGDENDLAFETKLHGIL
jgi:hypothetical protein